MLQDLLVEIGTEELPPKALKKLSDAFTDGIIAGLKDAGVAAEAVLPYAAPRRLAVWLQGVPVQQADQIIERKGPAVAAAFDKEGNPSKAAEGFARSCSVEFSALQQVETDKGAWLVFRQQQEGQQTAALFPAIVEKSLAALPIPKRMRWGSGTAEFVRPVHWIVMLAGNQVIDAEILGIKTGNQSRGHRFHAPAAITINTPDDYAVKLGEACVIARFEARRDLIKSKVEALAAELGGKAIMPEDLLDEVTALVEWPVPVAGRFEECFLDVPQEALISTMQDNQKYFALVDANGKLMPNFITVANIDSRDVSQISSGNERVIRPRFSDAEFFWNQDKKQTLASRREPLKKMVFQQKLGTLYDKSGRVAQLASYIAQQLGADEALAVRAAELGKCDLVTSMVFEFTELQGTMGRYYAQHDGEAAEVATAMEEQYMPRFAGDELPATATGRILALAERLDTLAGIFGIGQKPTGAKDPFALRRAALGVLRILIELQLPLDLADLLDKAADGLTTQLGKKPETQEALDYILERLRAYYQEQGIGAELVEAVASLKPTQPLDFDRRVKAVAAFRQLMAAESLAAANKRISNILKKVEGELPDSIHPGLLQLEAEQALAAAVQYQDNKVMPLFAAGEYEAALLSLAELREPVDKFFDDVMVMADDAALKNNRLALLNRLRGLFLRVADLSVL
ncbi:MAG TPA: glycine--tRNA ligase subunit beta [Candidatus Thiothrix moscowensis]|uniref:glycine--tRNA ligase subunit beta n=1 Tax=unclassified Thiothrix TaxID=2636184 RepID=UPI0025D08F38|nr:MULTISPECIES: glycine--tRNA ligase subunit beta [unclassified Thiothrix]HRJ51857.1 glycine--tRNA ligase subunit beta [Candidatus Thiothrix moscowensis]HRJ92172.1 glycine--tRNA ligase subunit beta [Candidatus Thiothrix moscowensis]